MDETILNELEVPIRLIRALGIERCTGKGICVAVVDSGIRDGHPHVGRLERGVRIAAKETGEFEVIEDRTDAMGHGTACAGIIRSLAPGCAIVSIRILDAMLTASSGALIRAIEWAAGEGKIDLLNLSLGTRSPGSLPGLEDACRRAGEEGIIIVAATGGDPALDHPASFRSVLGATSSRNGTFSVSPNSPTLFHAPAHPRPIPGHPREENFQGPSFATARISALVALIREAHTGIDAATAGEMLGEAIRGLT